jgi:ubiquinone/menaquinone biosynthesis C-methylase UbiE
MGAAFRRFEKAASRKLVMRVSAIEGYRLWAPIYDSGLNPVVALERRAMRSLLDKLQPSRVIDVACGTGKWLSHFQQAGADVFGCDVCEEMLSEATRDTSLRGRVMLAHAESIPFADSTADLVLCSLSLGYFYDIVRVFREFARTSKPGGLIAVSDLHPDALASGWTRSFKLGGQRYELEHYPRTILEIGGAASLAGLKTKLHREIHFAAPELSLFQQSGKEQIFSFLTSLPALFIHLWEKQC